MRAAVDVQYFTCHKGRVAKVEDGIDDLRDSADSLDWMEGLQEPMGLRFVHGRINDSGADGVESDARVCILNGERSRHGVEPSLGQDGNRGRYAGHRLVGKRCRDIHDMASFLLQHLTNSSLGHIEKSGKVGRHEPFKILPGIVCEWPRNKDPGVVDQHIYPAESLDGGLNNSARRIWIGNVAIYESQVLGWL